MSKNRLIPVFCALCGIAASAAALAGTDTPEVEPNDTKAAPQALTLASGDTITGNAYSGSSNLYDCYQIQTAPAALGIYRHQLQVTTTGTYTPGLTIRGANVLNVFVSPYGANFVADSTSLQSSLTTTTPPSTLSWYGFGKGDKVSVRSSVSTNVAVQSETYTLTLTSTPAPIIDAGAMPGGVMTISTVGQGHTTNTDMWVYDADLDPIPGFGNDNEPSPGTTTQSKLTRDISAPGDYYIAITNSNSTAGLANNQVPARDDRAANVTSISSYVTDFPSTLVAQVSGTNFNLSLAITDGAGVVHAVPATSTTFFEVVWVKFTVTPPAPADAGACCKPDGSCAITSMAGCGLNPLTGAIDAGSIFSAATTCVAAACAQPTPGRCCKNDGSCAVVSSYTCAVALGQFAVGTCAAACPSTLTTAPTMNGFGNSTNTNAGCVFFDVTAANAVNISALDLSLGGLLGAPQTVQVWTRPGTYLGFDNSADGWTQIDGGGVGGMFTLTSAGPVNLTRLDLPASVHVNAGETVAFCIGSVAPAAGGVLTFIRYIDTIQQSVVGMPFTNFSNADITLTCDRTRTALFAGTSSSPRGFAGRVYYTTGTPPADEFCCRGTTCASVAPGTCVGSVAGSSSQVIAACGAGNSSDTCCFADFNHTGGTTIDDLFLYLNAYFTSSPYANFGGDTVANPTIDDLFLYINAYFTGCQ